MAMSSQGLPVAVERSNLEPAALEQAVLNGAVERYEKLGRIGEGTYGVVYRARDRVTDELVALKKVRMGERERDGIPQTAVREIRLLRTCAHHPHIVRLRGVVSGAKPDSIFLVFDYAEHDLAQLLDTAIAQRAPPPFTAGEIKTLVQQLFGAVAFLHSRCVLHRDLKTSNLLYTNKGMLKLADFGLARTISPIGAGSLTPRVVTLWYRAPELLLGSVEYGSPVDAWGAGCVMGELLRREPLFPGRDEPEVWRMLVSLLGTPSERIWPGWSRLPRVGSVAGGVPQQQYNYLKRDLPDVSPAGVELLNRLLAFDPRARLTLEEAMRHAWFRERPYTRSPEAMPRFPASHAPPPQQDGTQNKRMRV